MLVLEHGRRVVRRHRAVAPAVVRLPAFHAAPAEVDASPPARADRAIVDLLPLVLADVSENEVARARGGARLGGVATVEGEAPRVPDAVSPDLRLPRRLPDERVVRRHRVRVRPALPRVDAQDLAAQVLEVLAGPE